jgi:hypothetical protein
MELVPQHLAPPELSTAHACWPRIATAMATSLAAKFTFTGELD